MDYLKQDLGFMKRLQIEPISAKAERLYRRLFMHFNMSEWKRTLALSSNYLAGICDMSSSEFDRCRTELKEGGYIEYRPAKGRADTVYELVKLYKDVSVTIKQEVEYTPPDKREDAGNTLLLPDLSPHLLPAGGQQAGQPNRNIYYKNKTERETRTLSPPSLEEVEAFCKENKLSVSAAKFVNHFSRLGWVDNNNRPVLNWRAKLSTWDNFEIPAVHGKARGKNREYSAEEWASLIDNVDDIEM